MIAPLLAAVGGAQTTSPEPCLGPCLMVSHRRNRSTGGCEPAEAPGIYQSGPEKPSVLVSVASTCPRTKAPCELAGQTQAPLSGRGLSEAQSPPRAFHLTAWASSSSDIVPWASSYSGPFTAPCHPLPSSGDPGTQKGKALGSETPAANRFPSLSLCLPPWGVRVGRICLWEAEVSLYPVLSVLGKWSILGSRKSKAMQLCHNDIKMQHP